MNDLRAEQRAATRAWVVAAVGELIASGHPAAVSVPAVAAQAGVGVATVYRYFPTKEALLDAAALGAVSTEAATLPTSLDEVPTALKTAWGELEEQLPLVRNQFASPLGRELHRRRAEVRHDTMVGLLDRFGIESSSPEGRRLVAMAGVLTSSTALLELHDTAGVAVDDAADWCSWALEALVRATQREVADR